MFDLILLACMPLCLPCLVIAYKIIFYNCLDSVFNQNILLLFTITGKQYLILYVEKHSVVKVKCIYCNYLYIVPEAKCMF